MEPALAIFRPEESVAAAVAWLRNFSDATLVTYGHVTSTDNRLLGVIVMRDLLLASPDQTLESLMVRDPFTLNAAMPVADASPLVLHRHYPVYPVCDGHQHLLGVVRGYVLFEEQAIEMSAQPGRMVGVEDEERLSHTLVALLALPPPMVTAQLVYCVHRCECRRCLPGHPGQVCCSGSFSSRIGRPVGEYGPFNPWP